MDTEKNTRKCKSQKASSLSQVDVVSDSDSGQHPVSVTSLLRQAEADRVKRRKLALESSASKPAPSSEEKAQKKSKIYALEGLVDQPLENVPLDPPVEVVLSESDDDVVTNQPEIIDLDGENGARNSNQHGQEALKTDFFATTLPQSEASGKLRSSIRLLCDLSEPSQQTRDKNNMDTVSLGQLVGASDLIETYQFNFSVQLEVFLSFLHEKFVAARGKVVFITGGSIFESDDMKSAIRKSFNVSEAIAPLPNRFASHHTKMMVNFFDTGEAEVVVLTSNFNQIDICGLTQAVWRSGRLKKGSTTTTQGKRFRLDLLRYLGRYGLSVTKSLIFKLEKYDFSSVDVELIASAPGVYDITHILDSGEYYGYAKLRQALQRNNLLVCDTQKRHNLLLQVTSIAYPYTSQKGHTSSVFSHLLLPLMFENWRRDLAPGKEAFECHQRRFNYSPHIVYPTKQDVAKSNLGYASGVALHFKYEGSAVHRAQYEQTVRPYLCKWNGSDGCTGREKVTPHVKYYACDNGDNWLLLRWVMVGSHNLLKQAWGYSRAKSGGTKMDISSYELSVLIPQPLEGKLVPVYGKDIGADQGDVPVRFPFMLPPVKYGRDDEPWSLEGSCGAMEDRWGNRYP